MATGTSESREDARQLGGPKRNPWEIARRHPCCTFPQRCHQRLLFFCRVLLVLVVSLAPLAHL